jgi:RNA-directed DNA polymerase
MQLKWACRQRVNAGSNHSIWDVRFYWQQVKKILKKTFLSNSYYLSPLKRYAINGTRLDCWDAQDTILLKAIVLLQLRQPLQGKNSSTCTHVKGNGGVKKIVEVVRVAWQD